MIQTPPPLACVICLLVLSLFSTSAEAQSFSAYRQEVLALYRQGLSLMRKGQYDRAILKHESALRLVDRMLKRTSDTGGREKLRTAKSNFSFLLGRCYEKKQKWIDAYRFYQQALRNEPRERVETAIKKSLKALWVRVKAQLQVSVSPPGAKVWVVNANGEKFYKQPPFTLDLPPGKTKVLVTAAGYNRQFQEIVLRPKDKKTIRVSLVSKAIQMFEVSVNSTPQGARLILVDARGRKWQGQTPWRGMIPPGDVSIQLSKAGRFSIRKSIKVTAMTNRRFSYRLPPLQSKSRSVPKTGQSTARVLGWTSVALAIVSVGAGATFLLLSSNEAAALEKKRGKPLYTSEEVNGHFQRGVSLNTAGIVSMVIAGVFTVSGVGLLFWGGKQKQRIQPQPTKVTRKGSLLLGAFGL